ncbi:hypothetical protein DPMN_106268 [Dreissena polymorpha]|uniref:Uncharacterized protein n=1 Tax=Dreissena polymorpha TaxID=45954 RepID=A0A9D4K4N4_DREPO|nr:hypothetical protein DPMN_106268 [Dreissena polymorpha]
MSRADGAAEAAGTVFRRMGLLKLLTLSWADGTDEAAGTVLRRMGKLKLLVLF